MEPRVSSVTTQETQHARTEIPAATLYMNLEIVIKFTVLVYIGPVFDGCPVVVQDRQVH